MSDPGDPGGPSDPARARFAVISLTRLAGALVTLFGFLIIGGAVAWPYALGLAVIALGLVLFAWLPIMLARRWRSPPR